MKYNIEKYNAWDYQGHRWIVKWRNFLKRCWYHLGGHKTLERHRNLLVKKGFRGTYSEGFVTNTDFKIHWIEQRARELEAKNKLKR